MTFASRVRIAALLLAIAPPTAGAQRGFTLTAVIKDSATGRPIQGAVVQMASGTRQFSVRSDEVGEANFREFEKGYYRVLVRRIGYAPLATDMDIQNDKKRELKLSPLPQMLSEVKVRGTGTGIYGVVGTSNTLEPIANARVQVAGARASVETDSTGQFFVQLKDPGTFFIKVSRVGFADQLFPLEVKRNEIADASTLLDAAVRGGSIPDGLWKDFDQRLKVRSINNTAIVTGSDIRRNPIAFLTSLELSSSFISRGLKLGSSVRVFLNGSPVPGYPADAIKPEEVTAVEVYSLDRFMISMLDAEWPPMAGGSGTGRRVRNEKAPEVVRYIVIWTRR